RRAAREGDESSAGGDRGAAATGSVTLRSARGDAHALRDLGLRETAEESGTNHDAPGDRVLHGVDRMRRGRFPIRKGRGHRDRPLLGLHSSILEVDSAPNRRAEMKTWIYLFHGLFWSAFWVRSLRKKESGTRAETPPTTGTVHKTRRAWPAL